MLIPTQSVAGIRNTKVKSSVDSTDQSFVVPSRSSLIGTGIFGGKQCPPPVKPIVCDSGFTAHYVFHWHPCDYGGPLPILFPHAYPICIADNLQLAFGT